MSICKRVTDPDVETQVVAGFISIWLPESDAS
jgi:hypothetical protein